MYPWHYCRIKKKDGTWFKNKKSKGAWTRYFAHLDTGNSAPTTITRALYDALRNGDADMEDRIPHDEYSRCAVLFPNLAYPKWRVADAACYFW